MTASPIAYPDERAVALVYNGSTAAVMMATPQDLTDFLRGFARSEGIVEHADHVTDIEVVEHLNGFEVRGRIPEDRAARLDARRRAMVGPVGCGLCGIESLEAATERPPDVTRLSAAEHEALNRAMHAIVDEFEARQVERADFAAMHAAGFFDGDGLHWLREDVGRHNALDKLFGVMDRVPDTASGVLVTSRLSYDLIQKCARIGVSGLYSFSRPTAGAMRLASDIGMTLATVLADRSVFLHLPEAREGD